MSSFSEHKISGKVIPRDPHESLIQYEYRVAWIEKNYSKDAIRLSRIVANKHFLKVKYNDEVEALLKSTRSGKV